MSEATRAAPRDGAEVPGGIPAGIPARSLDGCLDDGALFQLARTASTTALVAAARAVRDAAFGRRVTYSRKVFLPLTQLCRDVCHYCTFAKAPRDLAAPYMSLGEVVDAARRGRDAGCQEALFTLGERPERRYRRAAEWLARHDHASTIDYVIAAARAVLDETGLLPHVNAGTLDEGEIARLRPVAASMGLMLESASARLCAPGGPHHGSPDKHPARRLDALRRLGEAGIPTTTGLLVGIGETMEERVEGLLALRALHARHDHLQEIIVQNFRAKPGTRMAAHPEPGLDDLLRTVALARLAFGAGLSIQVPPNLNPGAHAALLAAGIDDWGGISPVTPDFVNPEAPWPHLDRLAEAMRGEGYALTERLTVYPRFVAGAARWIDPGLAPAVLRRCDADGLGRADAWRAGEAGAPPVDVLAALDDPRAEAGASAPIRATVEAAARGRGLSVEGIATLFSARGADLGLVLQAADRLRREAVGETVTYVVARNVNYTNVCTYACAFCAFSKGRTHANLRGRPYDLALEEVGRRVQEAWARGATEVCMQGGIHPGYTGETYLALCRAAKAAAPGIHVHAFSPLEVTHGARTLGLSVRDYLVRLREAGLGSLPGTAAEVLDDEVRAVLCPDKPTTAEWLSVVETAHAVGLRTTATIMFGHVEGPVHWARHLARVRAAQERATREGRGGFTEFVPLPFVAREAPIALRGRARPGPTFREAMLMHAVARLALHGAIPHVQASWVKLGPLGVAASLRAGVDDLGGTLMNESITRAAGATHGQEAAPGTIEAWIARAGRPARQRSTLYGRPPPAQVRASFGAQALAPIVEAAYRPARGRPAPAA